MAAYKTVIFDIGNVLVRFAWDEYVDALWDRQVALAVSVRAPIIRHSRKTRSAGF